MNAIPSSDSGDWIKRLSPTAHQFAILGAILLLVLAAGAVTGFVTAAVRDGWTGTTMLIGGGLLAGTLILAWLTWRLTAIWRRPGRSAFEQRYTRMWLIVFALGLPGGLALGFLGDFGPAGSSGAVLFSNSPVSPTVAILASLLLGVGIAIATVIYHRTVDDHEERAYLWGSSAGFHFLITALPIAWLLARGGMIAPVGTGTVGLLLIAAIVIQGAVAAWLKYR